MQIAQKLKELRLDRDLRQSDIATVIGTTQQYYGQYEIGKRTIPAEHVATLSNYYGVSADYMLGMPKSLNWPR